jgi:hypothetical protein
MINMPESKGKFFSVKFSTTIRGVRYTPSVCYKLTSDLQPVIEGIAKGDNPLARIYPEEVRFVTGVAYPVSKKEKASEAVPQTSSSVSTARDKTVVPASGLATVTSPADAALAAGKSVSKRSAKKAFTRQTGKKDFD